MADFQHSLVLFIGDDGLPLEFNVRNTNDKARLRAMIEYGGGLCTQSENAVHLITPGTRVLNAENGKKLVSSRYILDCVEENYLLDVNDYVFIISEAETSDISEDESCQTTSKKSFHLNIAPFKESLNCDQEGDIVDLTEEKDGNSKKTEKDNDGNSFTLDILSPEIMQELNISATSSESFIESSIKPSFNGKSHGFNHRNEPLTSTAKEPNVVDISENLCEIDGISPILGSQSIVHPGILASYKKDELKHKDPPNKEVEEVPLPVETAVSSSQEAIGALDRFDNFLLNKIQQKPDEELEEQLSQSYTVSSSADASKPPSVESQSYEILARGRAAFPAPDSLCSNLLQDRHAYIKKLECEVEKILEKPSPKSLQDKISLVKYICCVKKLPPSTVLASLQTL